MIAAVYLAVYFDVVNTVNAPLLQCHIPEQTTETVKILIQQPCGATILEAKNTDAVAAVFQIGCQIELRVQI